MVGLIYGVFETQPVDNVIALNSPISRPTWPDRLLSWSAPPEASAGRSPSILLRLDMLVSRVVTRCTGYILTTLVVVSAKSTSDASKAHPFPPNPNSAQSTISTVAREINEARGEATAIAVDTRDYESVQNLVAKTIEVSRHNILTNPFLRRTPLTPPRPIPASTS